MTNTRPWAAVWKDSNGGTLAAYSGVNEVFSSWLTTSVSTNRGGENPFQVTRKTLSGSEGFKRGQAGTRYFTVRGPSDFLSVDPPFAAVPPYDVANIWARTNPSRASVLLPAAIFELKDLPDMIRQAGRFLKTARRDWPSLVRPGKETRDLASANLALQFGWAPLVSDLVKMAKFQSSVDKRRKEIEANTSSGGYRRRITLGTSTLSISGSRAVNFGNYRNFFVPYTGKSTSKQWAVVKWQPTSPGTSILPKSDNELRRLLAGLTLSQALINAWEVLPWSWLIDYFTNIGDVLQAGNNHYAKPLSGSVMTTITTEVSHATFDQGDDRLSAGTVTIVRKVRAPLGAITLQATIPTLGVGQLSILSSLAVLKFRRTLGS